MKGTAMTFKKIIPAVMLALFLAACANQTNENVRTDITAAVSSEEVSAEETTAETAETTIITTAEAAPLYELDEGRKAGVENIEEVLRAAVRRCGHIHGARFHENMTDKTDLCQMCPQFLTPAAQLNFEQQVTICTHDELAADFHYCPFVTAFKKLEMSDEDIAL